MKPSSDRVVYTIGYDHGAQRFFGLLEQHRILRLVDIRLNTAPVGAGFAKRDDLAFFLDELLGVEYRHEPLLAPRPVQLDRLKRSGDWVEYEVAFLESMRERKIERRLKPALLFEVPTALMCAESTPARCHRRLVTDYLSTHWDAMRAVHLTAELPV